MKKQYDIDHKIQRNYIHWDVSTQCQLKCSYCYAINEYQEDWDKIDSWSRQLMVIKNIEKSTLPCFLGLLGGEPTIHPRYDELIELCYNAINKHPDGRIYVTTNGLQTNDWFQNHKIYNNFYFLWSIHFEYLTENNWKNILNNIKICIDKGFKNKVNVMLHPDKKYWKLIHKVIDELEKINIEIHPHFIYNDGDVHDLYNYSNEFYNEFQRFENYKKYLVFESDGEINIFNDYTIFKNKNTCFKNWSCYQNNYEISAFGLVKNLCFGEYADLTKQFNFFKNIQEIKPRICPHSNCNCDGLLKIYKEIK